MTFRNPESESDFHFPSPDLVNHSHGFYSVPGNYRDFRMFNLRVDLNPLPVLFSEKDFKSNFRLSGNFVPVGQFFSGQPLNFLQIGSRKWGVGVKWKLLGRLGKMAHRGHRVFAKLNLGTPSATRRNWPALALSEIKPRPRPLRLVQSH